MQLDRKASYGKIGAVSEANPKTIGGIREGRSKLITYHKRGGNAIQDLLYNLDEVNEMNTQQSFTDIEYQGRRRQTRRDIFLDVMNRIMPWKAWTEKVEPLYYFGERGRKPIPVERMLRMLTGKM